MTGTSVTEVAPPVASHQPEEIRRLRIWQRFHVAITALYGVPILLALALMCGYFYKRGLQIEMEALEGRLLGISTALAGTTDGDVFLSPTPRTYAAQQASIAGIGTEEPTISSIYLLRRTDKPGILEFVADWVRPGDEPAAQLLEEYDAATDAPGMLTGLEGPFVEKEVSVDRWGSSLSAYAPVRRNGVAVGIVGVDVTGERIDALRRKALLGSLAVGAATTLLLIALAQLVGRSIRDPLLRVITATDAISRGHFAVRSRLDRGDEFGLLGRRFDDMARRLEERELLRDTFGRYMSERLAKWLLGDPTATRLNSKELDATILFSDLRSYSTISERLSPTQVVQLLNEYMGEMSAIVDRYGGVVIEFLGDAVFAAFGAPQEDPDHPAQAVLCALAMHARIAELNVQWERSGMARLWQDAGVPALGARIGVHTGRVVAGNMGGLRRMRYAMIGDAVLVASRVEGLNKRVGTDLLVTEATVTRLPEPLRTRAELRGTHSLEGRELPITVFHIDPVPGSQP